LLKTRRFWIGLVFIAVFLGLFLWRVDYVEMGRALASADYIYLLPALAAYFAGVWLRAWRWQYILEPLGRVPVIRLFPLMMIGFMINDILPGRLSLPARAYIIGEKEGISKMASASTILVENVFDGLTLLFILVLCFFLLPAAHWPDWTTNVVWILSVAFVGALILLILMTFKEDVTQRLFGSILRIIPAKWRPRLSIWFGRALIGLISLRSAKRLLTVFALSVAAWACVGGMFYSLPLAFDLQQSFLAMLAVAAIANLAWVLVIMVPGGIGPFEFASKETLVSFGVSSAVAVPYAAVVHACMVLPEIILGFIFLWMANMSLSEVVSSENTADVQVEIKVDE